MRFCPKGSINIHTTLFPCYLRVVLFWTAALIASLPSFLDQEWNRECVWNVFVPDVDVEPLSNWVTVAVASRCKCLSSQCSQESLCRFSFLPSNSIDDNEREEDCWKVQGRCLLISYRYSTLPHCLVTIYYMLERGGLNDRAINVELEISSMNHLGDFFINAKHTNRALTSGWRQKRSTLRCF